MFTYMRAIDYNYMSYVSMSSAFRITILLNILSAMSELCGTGRVELTSFICCLLYHFNHPY